MLNHVLTHIVNRAPAPGDYFLAPGYAPIRVPAEIRGMSDILNTWLSGRPVEYQAYWLDTFLQAPDMHSFLTHRDPRVLPVKCPASPVILNSAAATRAILEWAASHPALFGGFQDRDTPLAGLRATFDVTFDPILPVSATLIAYAHKLEDQGV